MSRLFLTLVCGDGSYEDLVELFEPIKEHFDGLACVCHADRDSMEAKYLEMAKGAGCIVYLPYVGRHDMSRNVALHCGAIEEGDWVMQTDCLEHPIVSFIEKHVPYLCTQSKGIFLYYGKPFLFEYHESLTYVGTPHEGLRRLSGDGRMAELSTMWPDESQVRLNVRPIKRTDPLGWCLHYGRYYMSTPWGANHCLLGNEHRGDPMKLYQERESLRIRFRDYLRSKGIPLTLGGLHGFMDSAPKDPVLLETASKERILNDLYRLWVLKDESIVDDHTWSGMIPLDIPPQVG